MVTRDRHPLLGGRGRTRRFRRARLVSLDAPPSRASMYRGVWRSRHFFTCDPPSGVAEKSRGLHRPPPAHRPRGGAESATRTRARRCTPSAGRAAVAKCLAATSKVAPRALFYLIGVAKSERTNRSASPLELRLHASAIALATILIWGQGLGLGSDSVFYLVCVTSKSLAWREVRASS